MKKEMGEAGTKRPTLEEILRTLRRHLPELRERYRVKSMWIFGSYVRGDQKPDSDLDILVEFEEAPTLFQLMDLEEELEALLKVKVDLVTKKALRGEIGKRILEESVPL
ncbi:nucleotidyltransferase family protein [Candidatus Bipolaricaulota sp. J31]